MSVIVFAYHEMGCRCLRALLRSRVEVSAVFSHEDDPDEARWFGSVAALARDAGIPVFTPSAINEPRWVACVRDYAPELFVSVHYRRLIGRELLSVPARGGVNLHPSLLPRYRGRCPINWQLVHGETTSGVTLHSMTPQADAGDIIGQISVSVDPDDRAIDLYRKLLPAGERVLLGHIDAILDGTAPRSPQNDTHATTFSGRRSEDGRIDWSQPAQAIHNLVRAVAPPWPGAFSDLAAGGTLSVHRSRPHDAISGLAEVGPGELSLSGKRVFIGADPGALELLDFAVHPARRLESGELVGASALAK